MSMVGLYGRHGDKVLVTIMHAMALNAKRHKMIIVKLPFKTENVINKIWTLWADRDCPYYTEQKWVKNPPRNRVSAWSAMCNSPGNLWNGPCDATTENHNLHGEKKKRLIFMGCFVTLTQHSKLRQCFLTPSCHRAQMCAYVKALLLVTTTTIKVTKYTLKLWY